jgi:NADPH-dependent ferric siderophore reductase
MLDLHPHQAVESRVVVALRALHLPAEPGVAYVASEAHDCQSARRHLIAERGWPRTA